ncbi:2-succinylbenzoate--CoA ligase [Calothrix sp. CCY 0018]|uniref:2-succinylbenzoate--CoA ligase n=1 Tax=Calothrix sp. CCY 0018 TaxID=3103864 RepID=UPI0039C7486B
MEEYFTYFVNNDCLICEDNHSLTELIEKFYLDIIKFKQENSYLPKIILNQCQPVRFLASFIAACKANCPVFLCNPDWGKQEWQQVFDLVKPDIIWSIEDSLITHAQCPMPNSQFPYIMIPTGGSSGKIKFAVHTWDTLTASVKGFQEYFEVDKINSCCVLPLYHVSGLMQFMRCLITGGKLVILPFKELELGQNNIQNLINKNTNNFDFFISLVPTQLERLLQKPDLTQLLSKFETVLLGGAPAWDELLQKARFHHIRLAPTYGMTETASQIATMKPEDFLIGRSGCGKVLPHAKIEIRGEKGENLQNDRVGSINIKAESLALGYYPLDGERQTCLQIDDLAFLDEQGYLNIVGRNSHKIITGGENVYPAEVEAAIRATGMVADVCVIGVGDRHWGQIVTAIYVNKIHISNQEIQALLKERISNYKIPKVWICVGSLPRNSQGKINRQKLYEIVGEYA